MSFLRTERGMTAQEAQSEPVGDKIARLEALLDKQGKEMKGMKGQIGLIRGQVGLGRPGTTKTQAEPSPTEAQSTQTEPQSGHKMHEIFEWMRDCPNCGGRNPDYKKPTVKCANCGVPVSSNDDVRKELQEKRSTDKIKGCWNCGGSPTAKSETDGKEWQVEVVQ